ncbi:fungal-specific transcription factor domain-domain-containing protein [Syncephalastrum racemosum]|uniref:Fungal-specific transcription factor domain-domain-containing protein n=1 Tax=Syncephalastrum racemosum TaxID=13706 RepID=A0A1X2HU74_SYNRA|nr:fungal-specific transcription factor domain-domain-containing protein [Syncephalastrum racemosum]
MSSLSPSLNHDTPVSDSPRHDPPVKVPKQKRLKVNRACYTCRMKKIKCDGLQPCMQCRARQRPCSFSRAGGPDMDTLEDEHELSPAGSPTATPAASSSSTPGGQSSDIKTDNSPLHQAHETGKQTTEVLDALAASWPAEGREGRWTLNESLLYPSPRSERVFRGTHIDGVIQQQLIVAYFRYHYPVFPILPKRTFYEHMDRRGPLCTPLLFNTIYAHAHANEENAASYYQRAISMLVSAMETPRISTVIALCLLSLYEPRNHPSDSSPRLYSAMASRMCLDLGLHKRSTEQLSGSEIELRKRVMWACYSLDKMHSLCRGKPWLIHSKDIEVDMPLLQPGDQVEEHETLIYFVAFIKLLQIAERCVQVDTIDAAKPMIRSFEQEQLAHHHDNELLMWLRALPSHLEWTPFPSHPNAVPTQPPNNAVVAHLHLFFNLVQLHAIRPYSSQNESSSLHQRCSTIATNITQLTCSLTGQTGFILSYMFVADAIMAAIRVHLLNCGAENLTFARHSRYMFQRSLRYLRTLASSRVIPEVGTFAMNIKTAIADADVIGSTSADQSSDTTDNQKRSNGSHEGTSRGNSYNGLLTPPSNAAKEHTPTRQAMLQQPQPSALFDESDLWQHQQNPPPQQPTSRPAYPLDILSVDNWSKAEPTIDSFIEQHQQHSNETEALHNAFLDRRPSQKASGGLLLHHSKLSYEAATAQLAALMGQIEAKERSNPALSTNRLWTPATHPPQPPPHDDTMLYSIWHQQQQQQHDHEQQQEQQQREQEQQQVQQVQTSIPTRTTVPSQSSIQPSFMNIGLGVYASAHQHHTDVIRQHYPTADARNSRPVILTHHGHVIVAGSQQQQQQQQQQRTQQSTSQ